ncbi:protein-(glutamine-N5) methyltransferase, release factor-specific [Burkholderia sp. PAMC 28687]|jgi:release factor glutamine methyltransferase|uniref:Release factor glutamine methyltransferase n=1 Tax=Caballeronia sordidicola TaxID=196367 RepID=A0A2C9XXI0_CABSO|nr:MULTISPECIES: peptide chain release factor N(5)-glutamine methyltransferase [Burkholderiaceae]AMM14975.1 protein-(glutamine-N5) methyltransferase, release factor-specific [Burkholderia sp. PAMC 28687]OTP74850.1 Protein-N(5)-glutamine methyltransferase PrmC [Caballeronia sordidicola]
MTTVAGLLRASPLPALEARILLEHVLGWRRTELITRDDEELPEESVDRFEALARRRTDGEPIAQLVGTREFFGLSFDVTPDVLIPRPETELLVEIALAKIEGMHEPRVLDLGTGSGAIAVAIASSRHDAKVWAVDRSAEALAVAAANASKLLGIDRSLTFVQSNWTEALDPAQRFEVIVSNPPYIAQNDPHLAEGDLRFEPRAALTDEADGLSAIRTIIQTAPFFLAANGSLWLEHGYDQAEDVRALLTARGFSDVRSEYDLAGIERASGGVFAA